MKSLHAAGLAALIFLAAPPRAAAQTYTPTEYKVTLHKVELSTDGQSYQTVLDNASGVVIDLVDPNSFASAFATGTPIPAGNYKYIKMTVNKTLVWSHPNAPVSKSNQSFVVNGPPGPNPSQMTVYFTTHDLGGKPSGDNGGGDGTAAKPLLLGSGANIVAGTNTTLRMVFAVTGTLKDQGGSNYDLGPPQMFFVTENGEASTLQGTFNTVLYNTIKKTENNTIEDWRYVSGHGTLVFDGAGQWTWTGTTNDFDLKNNATGAINTSVSHSGRYGTSQDGSFWMVATGEPGTLQGAVSSDGKQIVATMYDSETSHMMFFGVERATAASVATLNTGYYFTIYGSSYNSGSTTLSYSGSFGIVTGNGSGGVSGTQDSNRVDIQNPMTTPVVTGPTTNLADPFNDTMTINANGTMSNSGEVQGGILESGDAACVCWDFSNPYTPSNKFGFLVRQSTAGTFTVASLKGTYFGGHFGDVLVSGTNNYFSGFFKIVFDGAGNATVTLLENREGDLTTSTFAVTYTVDANTGIVSFTDQSGPADIKGAIGPNAMSFILSAKQQLQSGPNDQRFLGLGLKQK